MSIVKCCDHFWVGNDFAIHNEIGNQFSNPLVTALNIEFPLLFDSMTSRLQFYCQGIFV